MHEFQIAPLSGVGPVTFGASRDSVHEGLAQPFRPFSKTKLSAHETDAFDALGFHIYYDGTEPTVNFIELFHADETVFRYKNTDVFRTKAADLVRLLSNESGHYEDAGSLIFPTLQFALYRSRPFDPRSDEFDRWEAFAVGISGYFAKEPPVKTPRTKPAMPNPFIRKK